MPARCLDQFKAQDAKEESSPAAEKPGTQDPDDKADKAVASQR